MIGSCKAMYFYSKIALDALNLSIVRMDSPINRIKSRNQNAADPLKVTLIMLKYGICYEVN
mgnify:CR=1 FL=1